MNLDLGQSLISIFSNEMSKWKSL